MIDKVLGRQAIANQWALAPLWLLTAVGLSSCQPGSARGDGAAVSAPCHSDPDSVDPVSLSGGRFLMGSEQFYREEGPVREVTVDPFRIDPFEVTRAQFAGFVRETGYVTVAERRPDPTLHPGIPEASLVPGAAVFAMTLGENAAGRWDFVPGANWRNPDGSGQVSEITRQTPVTQIAYADAQAYAAWAGGALPTEAQWEFAARAGKERSTYEWGDTPPDELDLPRANTWQGIFPVINKADDGYFDAAPVGCYPANDFGLYDMTGNVWEWVADVEPSRNAGVIKGGSYLCAQNYCRRYRPAARQPQELDFSTNHIGFRVAYPAKDNEKI